MPRAISSLRRRSICEASVNRHADTVVTNSPIGSLMPESTSPFVARLIISAILGSIGTTLRSLGT